MPNVREYLHVEGFLFARHNLHCPISLFGQEELVGVWHRKENRSLHCLALKSNSWTGLLPSTLKMSLSFMKDGCAIAPALQIPALES